MKKALYLIVTIFAFFLSTKLVFIAHNTLNHSQGYNFAEIMATFCTLAIIILMATVLGKRGSLLLEGVAVILFSGLLEMYISSANLTLINNATSQLATFSTDPSTWVINGDLATICLVVPSLTILLTLLIALRKRKEKRRLLEEKEIEC